MSIVHAFDPHSPAIIEPARAVQPIPDCPDTFFAVFSHRFDDLIHAKYTPEKIGQMGAGRDIGIYAFQYAGRQFGYYHTLLGGAGSAALLEECIAKGAKRVLFFGAAGSLDKALTAGHFVVPTAAWRDEGTSYHYMPPSDFVQIPTADAMAAALDGLRVPYIRAATWTTDAFYRETQANAAARKAAGCAVVEMECASVMAVGQYRGIQVYQLLYAADCLDGGAWDPRVLGNMPPNMNEALLQVALEALVRL